MVNRCLAKILLSGVLPQAASTIRSRHLNAIQRLQKRTFVSHLLSLYNLFRPQGKHFGFSSKGIRLDSLLVEPISGRVLRQVVY